MEWGLIAQILSVPAALAAVFSNTRTTSGIPNAWGWILIVVTLVGATAIYQDKKQGDQRIHDLAEQVRSVEGIVETTRKNVAESRELERVNRETLTNTQEVVGNLSFETTRLSGAVADLNGLTTNTNTNIATLQGLSTEIRDKAEDIREKSLRLINVAEFQLQHGAYSLVEVKTGLTKSEKEYMIQHAGFSVELKDFGRKGGIQVAIEDKSKKNLVEARYVVSGQPYQFSYGLHEYLVIPTRPDSKGESVDIHVYKKNLYRERDLAGILGLKPNHPLSSDP